MNCSLNELFFRKSLESKRPFCTSVRFVINKKWKIDSLSQLLWPLHKSYVCKCLCNDAFSLKIHFYCEQKITFSFPHPARLSDSFSHSVLFPCLSFHFNELNSIVRFMLRHLLNWTNRHTSTRPCQNDHLWFLSCGCTCIVHSTFRNCSVWTEKNYLKMKLSMSDFFLRFIRCWPIVIYSNNNNNMTQAIAWRCRLQTMYLWVLWRRVTIV